MFSAKPELKGWDGSGVDQKIRKLAGRGLQAAIIHFTNRVKELISIPAPRRKAFGRYVATERASPGAPPRKLSGSLRRSMNWQMRNNNTVARSGTIIVYGRRLEKEGHPYLSVTMQRAQGELATIMGRSFNSATG